MRRAHISSARAAGAMGPLGAFLLIDCCLLLPLAFLFVYEWDRPVAYEWVYVRGPRCDSVAF